MESRPRRGSFGEGKTVKLGIECVIKHREDQQQSSAQALQDIHAKEQAAFAKKHLFK